MQRPLKPCNEPNCPNLTRKGYCANSIREPSRPMINTGSLQPNGGITASGGRPALATCPSIRYVLPA